MKYKTLDYCNNITHYSRFKTREVLVGNIGVGGDNPIRIQSMTTTNTMDTLATVEQSIRMINAGCEIVRITAPSKKEAENLKNIKQELIKRGYHNPLVADIHFTPNAAEIAATIVEKVRINPGNYADKKRFQTIIYTNEAYKAELERIKKRFLPLVKICKQKDVAMRIGTNHGSLSDRILSKYGDTPLGMVESALEFVRICENKDYYNIILSMKASNTRIMIQAYRLLMIKMKEENMNYPIHLGVTEAGEGEDGRIKSALGIGSLLEDGIGDTIRVSLTEEPEDEIPVALNLLKKYKNRVDHNNIKLDQNNPIHPFEYHKRKSIEVLNIGNDNVPVVIANLSLKDKVIPASLFSLGYQYSIPLDKWSISEFACDYLFLGDTEINFETPGTLGVIYNYKTWLRNSNKKHCYPLLQSTDYMSDKKGSNKLNLIHVYLKDITQSFLERIKKDSTAVLLINSKHSDRMAEQRRIFIELINHNCNVPVIICQTYQNKDINSVQLYSATDIGSLLTDGLGDGIHICSTNCGSPQQINQIGFGILQASRTRISKTEYISCPSCGRTLFDLQETTAKIRLKTNHLKGLKIGIMGCIVNGPGEMADADYGYVGTGKNKVSLYKQRIMIKKDIPTDQALHELINLIKKNGDWVDR
jgi:(E)-4-hydroxy-3-methylbut-2-enyl-diphosphate synthase